MVIISVTLEYCGKQLKVVAARGVMSVLQPVLVKQYYQAASVIDILNEHQQSILMIEQFLAAILIDVLCIGFCIEGFDFVGIRTETVESIILFLHLFS